MSSIKLFIIELIYKVGNLALKLLRYTYYKKYDVKKVKKVIVFRTGSIGDTICAMPALTMILENLPKAQVDLLINAGGEGKISPIDILDTTAFHEIIDYTAFSRRKLFSTIKNNDYDLFIELSQYDASLFTLIRNVTFAKLTGVKFGIGWEFSQHFWLKKTQEKYRKFINERDRLVNMLYSGGLEKKGIGFLFPKIELEIDKRFQDFGLDIKDRFVAIVVGSNQQANMWPIENFEAIAKLFISMGYKVMAVGGPKEKELLSKLEPIQGFVNLCSSLTPLESTLFLKECILVISNDTGPMHMAYAMNTPVVALFSTRDFPGKWYPPLNSRVKNRVIRSKDKSNSISIDQPNKENRSMKQIKFEDVKALSLELLAQT